MRLPAHYLSACNCATWQEAQSLIEAGHPDEAILLAAWQAVAILAPAIEVKDFFQSHKSPDDTHFYWQSRYFRALADERLERARATAQEWNLNSTDEMLAVLNDTSQPTPRRLAAIDSLAQIRHRPAILPLIAAMHEEPLANACSRALIDIGSRRHLRRLVNLLKPNTPDYLKQEAIYVLWMLDDRRGACTLAQIALDRTRESDHTRVMATEALGINVQKLFIQRILAKAMNDPDVGVRMSVLCASGRHYCRRHLQVLTRAIESRFDDPELIYDEPFGAHVRRIQEGHEQSLRHFLDGRLKSA